MITALFLDSACQVTTFFSMLLIYYAPCCVFGGGIKRYRDPSVCLSHGAAALGYRHAGCLQLCHRQPPEMCRLRTRLRMDVDLLRVKLLSVGTISSRRPRGDNLFVLLSECEENMQRYGLRRELLLYV